jgi:hypothetical protein
MAIIKPSNKFVGSELNVSSVSTGYIKEGIRKALFNKTTNQDGAYVYFLPAYKVDVNGDGVWYKRIHVRDNFGLNFKEKYYVANTSEDPAHYFANNLRMLYPEEAKPVDSEMNGRKFKKYPACGRSTERVVYNVAFANNLSAGAHVLDLPLRNGADILQNWLEGRDISGNMRPPINDPDRCLPVFLKLKDNSINPWMIQVETSQPVQLPPQLADSDYIYNLDDIFLTKSKEEVLSQLRDMYSAEMFDACMNGFPGLTRRPVQVAKSQAKALPIPQQDDYDEIDVTPVKPVVQAAPVISIPKASITAPVAAVNPPPAADIGMLPANPMASGRLSREEAMRFMSQE